MDIGLGSFLEKFEEHYGKRATKILLGFVGAAAICFCLGTIWQFILPIGTFAYENVSDNKIWFLIGRYAFIIGNIGVVITGGAFIANLVDTRRTLNHALEAAEAVYNTLENSARLVERFLELEELYEAHIKGIGSRYPNKETEIIVGKIREMRDLVKSMADRTASTLQHFPDPYK